ncbi:Alpha/Beta hydrolase protein [Trichoderma sp. SZMC 28013]
MSMTVENLMQQCFTVHTADQYDKFVQQHDLPPVREEIPGGGSALWFGSPSAKRVIAHMHGGGLVMYASTFHFGLAYEMYKAAIASDDDVALAVLAYDTCPSAPYPTQLRQLVAFVTHLMHGRDSKDIDLYGDSAGGLLILSLLLHVVHPHPKIPPLSIPSGHRLGRILMISPTTPMVTPAMTVSKNFGRDLVGVDEVAQMWSVIEGNHDPDVELINPWFAPLSVLHEDWFETLPAGAITIVSGGLEIFEEDIAKLAQIIKNKHQDAVDIHVDQNVGHIAFLKEGLMGIPPSEYTTHVIEWAKLRE